MDVSSRHQRYRALEEFALPDRAWPDRRLTAAPRWLSTDLRDGNQALATPMDPARKLLLFERLVAMGYQEIEVGFPAAGRDEYDFVRGSATWCSARAARASSPWPSREPGWS